MRALALFTALGVGCGGGGTGAAAPEKFDRGDDPGGHHATGPDVDDDSDDGIEVSGTKMHLDQRDVENAIKGRGGELTDCHVAQLRKRGYLGGNVKIGFKVAADGSVISTWIMESDLGSWQVENCLLGVFAGIEFPRPHGRGTEATSDISLRFDQRRATKEWSEDESDAEVKKLIATLEPCENRPGDVWITFYAGTRGQVLSAGFAGPDPIDPTWAACAADTIAKWTVSDPRGQIAKGYFRWAQ